MLSVLRDQYYYDDVYYAWFFLLYFCYILHSALSPPCDWTNNNKNLFICKCIFIYILWNKTAVSVRNIVSSVHERTDMIHDGWQYLTGTFIHFNKCFNMIENNTNSTFDIMQYTEFPLFHLHLIQGLFKAPFILYQ